VADREYLWTDEGLADVRRNKLAVDEVIEAFYAPPGLRYERRLGDLLLIVIGTAGSGKVIAVFCDQVESTTTYRIMSARPLSPAETDEWRRRVL
jgi:hypothetical protein